MRRLVLLTSTLLALAAPAFAQTALNTVYLQDSLAAQGGVATIRVSSGSAIAANDIVFVDREALQVASISGAQLSVLRGSLGTAPAVHVVGALAYTGPSDRFADSDVAIGDSCASATFTPSIYPRTGRIFACQSGVWVDLTGVTQSSTIATTTTVTTVTNVSQFITNGAGSALLTGGQVVWTTGLTFIVSAATYTINGTQYSSPQTSVTLSASDPSNPRIDAIVLNSSSAVAVVAGTAAASPSEPTISSGDQLRTSIVLVAAGATTPTVTDETVYTENAGHAAEWDCTNSGATLTCNSTTSPRTGTKDVQGTAVTAGHYVQFAKGGGGTINPQSFDLVVFYVRSKAMWNNNRGLRVQLLSSGVVRGQQLSLRQGAYGFDSSITSSYQQIAIPMSEFAITPGLTFNQIRLVDFGGSIGFYVDDVKLQDGGANTTLTFLTMTQADARYATNPVNLATQVTGDLSYANFTAATGASLLLGRGSASGAGDWQEIALGTNITMSGTTLNVAAGSGIGDVAGQASSVDSEIALFSGTGGKTIKRATGTGVVHATSGVFSVSNVNLATEVTGTLAASSLGTTGLPQFARVGIGAAADASAALTVAGQIYTPEISLGSMGTTETVNWNSGNQQRGVLDNNITFTFSNPKEGGRYLFILTQDGTGSRTATWPAAVKWSAGTAPTLTTTAGATDICTFAYTGVGGGLYLGACNLDIR